MFSAKGKSKTDIEEANRIKHRITAEIGSSLKTMQIEHQDLSEPIDSKSLFANGVCTALEAAFLHGLKSSATKKNFWDFLTKVTHKDTLSQLNHLGQITSAIGMCRAWIRVALNDGVLGSYLETIMKDKATIRYFYSRTAYFRDEEQLDILNSYVQGLCNFWFQLSYNASTLNKWSRPPLQLCGVLPSSPNLQPVVPDKASSSANYPDMEPLPVSVRLTVTQHLVPDTPPNTPLDSNLLSQSDIEKMRQRSLRHANDEEGSTSTGTSQVSHPDPGIPSMSPANLAQEHIPWPKQPLFAQKAKPPVVLEYDSDTAVVDTVATTTEVPVIAAPTEVNIRSLESENTVLVVPFSTDAVTSSGGNSAAGTSSCPSSLVVDADEPLAVRKKRRRRKKHAASGTRSRDDSPASQDTTDDVIIARNAELQNDPNCDTISKKVDDSMLDNNNGADEERGADAVEPKQLETDNPPSIYDVIYDNCVSPAGGISEEAKASEDGAAAADNDIQNDAVTSTNEPAQLNADIDEYEILAELRSSDCEDQSPVYDVTAQSNNLGLGSMQGWSSDFVEREKHKRRKQISSAISPSLSQAAVEDNLKQRHPSNATEDTEYEAVDEKRELAGVICNEKGLDYQNYSCQGCSCPLGIIYGQGRVCAFDGMNYCPTCHENDEYYIPSRIAINWDFRKHKVCKQNLMFLRQSEEEALIDIEKVNLKLYDHIPAMMEAKELRVQLCYLKAYLCTCSQSVAEDFRRRVWPRVYLYDSVHRYSLSDFLQIAQGVFATTLKKLVKFAQCHVYECRLCTGKGFICELCEDPNVIYPFESETTSRCEKCHSVYHLNCRPTGQPCPRCRRRLERRHTQLDSTQGDPEDYTCVTFREAPED